MRRSALWFLAPLSGLLACQNSSAPANTAHALQPPQPEIRAGAKNVGILIFDGLFITEFVAPFDIYKHVGEPMNVFSVAESRDPIRSYEGVTLHPDFSFADCPKIDVLVVPSGLGSTSTDLENAGRIAFVKARAANAQYITSHCWGAFTLAQAGLLDGRPCTTFPSSVDDLQTSFPKVKAQKEQRFVVSDNVITSNGGVAAFEAALYVVEQLYGNQTADTVADGLVFADRNRQYSTDPHVVRSE